jgi:RNA polymerase sigma-70 factor (ECF subfamily)
MSKLESAELEGLIGRFAALVRRVGRQYRLSDADLDDVLQEVRIRLWRVVSGGSRDGEKIDAVSASYVQRTAMSAAIDLMRRRRARGSERTVALDDVQEPSDASDPSQSVEESDFVTQLAQAIGSITPSRRPVVRMYLAGYSSEEVAAALGWSEAKTRNLIYRGLADLRERLTEMGITWKTTA